MASLFEHIFVKTLLASGRVNELESLWLRKRMASKHDIHVGLYSYGCFDLRRVPSGTVIGRYCSFSRTCTILNANHGISFLSLHPYFYNPKLGLVSNDLAERKSCIIEDDVWIGHNATILAGCTHIGRGAIIGAGAVVTKDVPPYSIVTGCPAKVSRYRFTSDQIRQIEESQWWMRSKQELANILATDPMQIYKPFGA